MKQAIPVILFILLTGIPAVHGQFIRSVGFKAGISLANQSYRFTPIDYTLETSPVLGPGIAIFIEALSREHLSIQLDLAYAAKGSKTTIESVTVNHLENNSIVVNVGDLKVSKFNYLSLTPLARYRFDRERLSPYIVAGLRLDYLLNYKTDSDYPLEEQNKFIMGLSGGVGVEYNLNKLGVFFEVQYQPDINPVISKDPLLINNNILLITLGIRYLNTQ